MSNRKNLLVVSFVLFLMGCNGKEMIATVPEVVHATLPNSTSLAPTLTLTATPTGTMMPTQTTGTKKSVTSTPTLQPTLTPSPTVPPGVQLGFNCLEVSPEQPPSKTYEGTLVLDREESITGEKGRATIFVDMATGNMREIAAPDEIQVDHTISLDRKFLAYTRIVSASGGEIVQVELIITSADGKRLAAIPWEEGWVSITGWLEGNRLMIRLAGLDSEDDSGQKAATFLVLDPFTGERQIPNPDFPDFLARHLIPYWEGWLGAAYDPTLTRVIYPKDIGSSDYYTYAIWDLQRKSLVMSLESVFTDFTDYFPTPSWSPDGSHLVVEGYFMDQNSEAVFELFLVSRDGVIEQLTNIYSYEAVRLDEYSWSPDGRYIAAWLKSIIVSARKPELVILDTKTHQIIDYCIRVRGMNLQKPVWSPDGKQVIVVDGDATNRSRVILVDLSRGTAFQILNNLTPIGWMAVP